MSRSLRELEVLVLDCQASGATPALGDLLELGWAISAAEREVVEAHARWITPASKRRVSAVVRQLTGWSEACLRDSVEASVAWELVQRDAGYTTHAVPTIIHFARFELSFLRDVHVRAGGSLDDFPLDVVCVHAIAERLFPDLPRRNLRALAGHLGHSAELVRRASGHVTATAAIWRALVPRLAALEVTTWEQLEAWLATPVTRTLRKKRVFPMAAAVRRALPDRPGVYRFLRSNGDVLYVGKATSLRKRVASHFSAGVRTTERALEMLSQAHDIDATPTATSLEAALLETDEIKRLDPPYNVQLRGGDRHAWFCDTNWSDAMSAPDAHHPVGPLPSRWSLVGLAAIRALLEGADASDALRAAAVEVPLHEAPDAETFARVWHELVSTQLADRTGPRARLLHAGAHITPAETPADAAPSWDPARIRRHLERAIVDGVTLIRRARLLSLLSHAHVTFHEPQATPRTLVIHAARIVRAAAAEEASALPVPPRRAERLAAFDAERYDQLRILSTELRRILQQGGRVDVQVGKHRVPTARSSHGRSSEP